MNWSFLVIVLTLLTIISAINRPVYKVVLTQKGYTQFLQYDIETPPLREFTFCTWIRTYDLGADQSIFTYVANGNSRALRLWLDSGGKFLTFSIEGKVTSKIPVDVTKDVWRHMCLSYQSDYGAWAVYIDAKLSLCESTRKLYGYVLPGGGSVIIGYGTTDNGESSGFEGEMFGANMLLASTVERNNSIILDHYNQQSSHKNKRIKDSDRTINYVVFSDLQTDEIHNNFEKTVTPPFMNKSKSYIKINTLHSSVSHDVGLEHTTTKFQPFDLSNENEFSDFPSHERVVYTTEKNMNIFWNTLNDPGKENHFKINKFEVPRNQMSFSGTKDVATISEYETPPPPPPKSKSFYTITNNNNFGGDNNNFKKYFRKKGSGILPNAETPPPPQKDNKVYGQWTSSKFAGSVLNYLKSINFHNRDKKVTGTIPLLKTSDSYPYASDFKVTKIKPSVQFHRRNFIDNKIRIHKRGVPKLPEINVQIIEDGLRADILRMHAITEPRNVEVTSRGESQKHMENRFYRNVDGQPSSAENSGSVEDIYKPRPRPFSTMINTVKKNKMMSDLEVYKNNNLMTILPFLKSLEYFVEDPQIEIQPKDNVERSSDMYSKSLSNGNKWHNIKSYNNDYTPRHINIGSTDGSSDIDIKIAEANKKHPSLRLKYKHEKRKDKLTNDDETMIKGRELATRVSNQSSPSQESISIIKYNHGYLPSHATKDKMTGKLKSATKVNSKYNRINDKGNFNKQVKLGNALNERQVIGSGEEQKKLSFVGGNERVPDIHRYRSDIDDENTNVPSSLKPKTCRYAKSEGRPLYIQQDESIIVSHIESPVRKKNIATEFIRLNYNQCSLEGSSYEKSYLLFIDWRKTPVRLFGGAQPKRTTDLCGFF
ncbi:unnamed protein product [Chilo suppressalis]|uniref:Pentraxin (PTX) domain-containing protein n=1 Tax=Chilo suppressalis TaxID=168631 RepID=A0ABN8L880_CHISP|nr:unnamed protein product [Chilo suppressalis]